MGLDNALDNRRLIRPDFVSLKYLFKLRKNIGRRLTTSTIRQPPRSARVLANFSKTSSAIGLVR